MYCATAVLVSMQTTCCGKSLIPIHASLDGQDVVLPNSIQFFLLPLQLAVTPLHGKFVAGRNLHVCVRMSVCILGLQLPNDCCLALQRSGVSAKSFGSSEMQLLLQQQHYLAAFVRLDSIAVSLSAPAMSQ